MLAGALGREPAWGGSTVCWLCHLACHRPSLGLISWSVTEAVLLDPVKRRVAVEPEQRLVSLVTKLGDWGFYSP